jgi:polar amino acid transport system substrate-binding protein
MIDGDTPSRDDEAWCTGCPPPLAASGRISQAGRYRLRRAAAVVLVGLGWVGPAFAQADPATVSTRPLLRVFTGYSSPFVKPPGTPVSGYSVEIWHEVARRLGVETAWTVLPDLSDDAQLAAVVEGRADLAISALAITAEREAKVDFSVPYFDAGLQILVGTQDGGVLRTTLAALASPAMLGLLGIGAVVVLALAHVLWLVERRHNPAFRGGYLRAVAEGLWGVLLIIATGEHGDRDTPRAMKRVVVGAMWLFGVVLIAQFTATVTAALTVGQLRSSIQGPDDLPGKAIATAPGSVAATWLASRGLPFVPVSDSELAYDMLIRGEVQAIVYEAPQLQHWIATRGPSMAALVGPVFRPEKYAIAVPIGSSLRKRINEALLTMQADGTADEVERRWFATSR